MVYTALLQPDSVLVENLSYYAFVLIILDAKNVATIVVLHFNYVCIKYIIMSLLYLFRNVVNAS